MMKKLKQLNFDESWIIFKSRVWKTWTPEQLVFFQLNQYYLCVGIQQFETQLSKLAKVHNCSFQKIKDSDEYKQKVLKRFTGRTQCSGWAFEQLVPGSLRSILKNKNGGDLAHNFSEKLKQRLYEKDNKETSKGRTSARRNIVRRRTS